MRPSPPSRFENKANYPINRLLSSTHSSGAPSFKRRVSLLNSTKSLKPGVGFPSLSFPSLSFPSLSFPSLILPVVRSHYHKESPADNDIPTPKVIKEKLDKYYRAGSSKPTFSMDPTNVTAPATASTHTSATPTPTPRKPRTSKKAIAATIQGSFCATRALTVGSTPALATTGSGAGVNSGRGRGRPRKTATPALIDTNTCKNKSTPKTLEPVLKRIKTEDSSPGAMVEVQIPVSPDPARFQPDSDEDTGPGVGLRLKHKAAQRVKAPTITAHEKEKKRTVPKRNTRNITVEKTEAYARCGEVVDCKGTCCGEPRCIYCFGEWDNSPDALFS